MYDKPYFPPPPFPLPPPPPKKKNASKPSRLKYLYNRLSVYASPDCDLSCISQLSF